MKYALSLLIIVLTSLFCRASQNYSDHIQNYDPVLSDEPGFYHFLDAVEKYSACCSEREFCAVIEKCNASCLLPAHITRLFHKKYAQMLKVSYDDCCIESASELMCVLVDWEMVITQCIFNFCASRIHSKKYLFQVCCSLPYQYIFFYRLTVAEALKIFYFIYKRGALSTQKYPERVAALYQKMKICTTCL